MVKRYYPIKRIVVLILVVCMVFGLSTQSSMAATEYYYIGSTILSNNVYKGTDTLVLYKDEYYLTASYNRCLTYFHDAWIANQGQIVTISSTVTRSRTVSAGVSAEVGVSDVTVAKLGGSYQTSTTTTYSSSLGLTYDLSNFSHSSYKIASMGRYSKFSVKRYNRATGNYKETYVAYAYDAGYGQEIRLVYRY